jgi:hypothetical protein
MALGIALAIVGFLFLDRYLPGPGLIWNIINGTLVGIKYRYVLAIAVLLFLFGSFLWTRK